TADQIQALAGGASPLALASFRRFITTDLTDVMRNVSASAYIRIPFTVAAPGNFDSLPLYIRYDDGVVAYLHGVEVAGRNAPANANYASTALSDRPAAQVLAVESIDLPGAATLLRDGTNILALHGLNDRAASPDFLLWAELGALRFTAGRYLPQPTPG